jgi:hypothetical protein
MKSLKDTIKGVIKKNPSPAGSPNTDPGQLGQYSAANRVSEDITATKTGKRPKIAGKNAGEPRSHDKDSPTIQHAKEIEKAKKHYLVKTPPGALKKEAGSQTTQLTPEETQMNEAKKRMSGADKWRQASYDREKAHKEFMKSISHLSDKEQTKIMMDKIKADRAAVHKEESVGDPKSATQSPADGANGGQELGEKKMSKKTERIMSIHKRLKEDMFDHEKEDKSVKTYGKKPKFEKAEKDEGGEKKPQAAAIMTGGTTLTGSKRDDIEIDPMMRNRPGQPDVTKKDDKKKDDKKEDKKKDK